MASTNKPWFEELTVAPLIAHAVKVLRTAIPGKMPPGPVGITIAMGDGRLEYDGAIFAFGPDHQYPSGPHKVAVIPLTDQQKAAAWLLVAVAAYGGVNRWKQLR